MPHNSINKGFRTIYHILIFKSLIHSIIHSDYLISLVLFHKNDVLKHFTVVCLLTKSRTLSHSPELSSILPFSLLFPPFPSPLLHPNNHALNFCLKNLSASNFQENRYMFFFGFTILFGFVYV